MLGLTIRSSAAASLIVGLALLGVGCDASAAPGLRAPTPRELPGVDVDVSARIPALDVVTDDRGSWHVAWTVSTSGGATRLYYARGDSSGHTWTSPRLLADGLTGEHTVRILRTSGGLHILFDKSLRHLSSRDSGATWQEEDPLIAQERIHDELSDAAVIHDRIVAAYLTHPRVPYDTRQRKPDTDQALYVVSWSEHGRTAPLLVAGFPGSIFEPLAPRLVADSSRLHLLLAIHAERQRGPSVQGKLYYLRSDDAGGHWSDPVDIRAAAPPSADEHDVQSMQGIDMIVDRRVGGIQVVYNETNVYATQSADATHWSAPERLNPSRPRGPGATYHSQSVAAAVTASGGRVAWIDTDRRGSDRSWLNPLGGFPWSDDPDWSNSDVLLLPLAVASPSRSIPAPRRLTPDQAYAQVVRVRSTGDSLLVVWSGRRKVGKRLDSFREKPRIFYVTLPSSRE